MKKFLSKLLIDLIICSIFATSFVVSACAQSVNDNVFFTFSNENFSEFIPDEANKFAIQIYNEMTLYAKDYRTSFNLSTDDFYNIKLGEPFCIFDVDQISQKAVFYYPILNGVNQYILLLTVIDTNHSLQASLDNELVNALNKIDYLYTDYVFYKTNNELIAQSQTDVIFLNAQTCDNPYSATNYESIHENLILSLKNFKEYNVEENLLNSDTLQLETYSAAFSSVVNDSDYKEKMLKLHNAKGQGNYSRCWAASVATIINYLRGTNVSAAKICDVMNIDYDAGGSIYDKQNALIKYGIFYSKLRNRTLSWTEIKKNIDNKNPVAMSAVATNAWHAVTLVGYRSFKVNQYVAIWDSASNGNNGATKVIYYSGANTTFQSSASGPIFTWIYSLSQY